MVRREAKWCMGHHKTQSPGIIHRMSSVERKCIVVRDYMHAHSEGKMRDGIMKKRIVYFLDFSCAFCTFSCDLITFFTILASSTRKARMMLVFKQNNQWGITSKEKRIAHRDLTQSPHLEPPYARRTVFTRFETVAYWRGRRAGIYNTRERSKVHPRRIFQQTYARERNAAVTALG